MNIIIMISSSDAVQWYDKYTLVHYGRHFSILKCTIYMKTRLVLGQESFVCGERMTTMMMAMQYLTSYVCAVLRRGIVLLKIKKKTFKSKQNCSIRRVHYTFRGIANQCILGIDNIGIQQKMWAENDNIIRIR